VGLIADAFVFILPSTYLYVPVDQPVKFKVFVVVSEGIDQLLSYLEETHVEEELQHGEDWDVEVDVQWNSTTWHSLVGASDTITIDLLSPDDGEDEEEVGGEGDHLGVHHRDGHPVVAPEQAALCPEFTKLLESIIHQSCQLISTKQVKKYQKRQKQKMPHTEIQLAVTSLHKLI
jgi:hypothetical protein